MKYSKQFIILKQDRLGYSFRGKDPSGRAIIEASGNDAKILIAVQDLKPENLYKAFLIKCDAEKSIGVPIGTVCPDASGKCELKVATPSENAFGSGIRIDDMGVVAIMISNGNEVIAPLVGYKGEMLRWKNNFVNFASIEKKESISGEVAEETMEEALLPKSVEVHEMEAKACGTAETEACVTTEEQEPEVAETHETAETCTATEFEEQEPEEAKVCETAETKACETTEVKEQEPKVCEVEAKEQESLGSEEYVTASQESTESEHFKIETKAYESTEVDTRKVEIEAEPYESVETQTYESVETQTDESEPAISDDRESCENHTFEHLEFERQEFEHLEFEEHEFVKPPIFEETMPAGVPMSEPLDVPPSAEIPITGVAISFPKPDTEFPEAPYAFLPPEQSSLAEVEKTDKLYEREEYYTEANDTYSQEIEKEEPAHYEEPEDEFTTDAVLENVDEIRETPKLIFEEISVQNVEVEAENEMQEQEIAPETTFAINEFEEIPVQNAEVDSARITTDWENDSGEETLAREIHQSYNELIAGYNEKTDEFVEADNADISNLFHNASYVKPFLRQNKDVKWIKISKKELVLLDVDFWKIMNNTFILACLKRYNHLILGRVCLCGKAEYYLGVPDIYNHEYRTTAYRLGFNQFKCAKDAAVKDGEFGYWLMPVSVL